jgi:hypothetical protein
MRMRESAHAAAAPAKTAAHETALGPETAVRGSAVIVVWVAMAVLWMGNARIRNGHTRVALTRRDFAYN